MALAVPKGQKSERIDPFVLSEPWRGYVQSAQAAKLRFDRIVQGTRPGPLRDRLAGLAERLDEGIAELLADRQPGRRHRRRARPARTRRRPSSSWPSSTADRRAAGATPALEATVASLEAQLASAQRMQAVSQRRPRPACACSTPGSTSSSPVPSRCRVGAGDTGGLADEVDGVVTELEALRLALEETTGRGVATGPEPPAT